jgi:hypothetical protein
MLVASAQGPAYLIHIISEFGKITLIENIGEDDEEALARETAPILAGNWHVLIQRLAADPELAGKCCLLLSC